MEEFEQLDGDSNTGSANKSQEIELFFNKLDEEVKSEGVDALAWYTSFHNTDEEWGIYIPLTSIHYLADRLFENEGAVSKNKFELALAILLKHERFHFLADYAQTQLELLMAVPCRYLLQKQMQAGQYLEIEEALANAYMLTELKKISTIKQFKKIISFIKYQPPGYRDAEPYYEYSELYEHGLIEVVKAYAGIAALDKNPVLPVDCIDWKCYFEHPDAINFGDCPVHIFHDDVDLGLPSLTPKFLKCLPDIRETKKFQKKFAKLARQYQESWEFAKQALKISPPNPKQFEALVGKLRGYYSVRVGGGHRAHLRPKNKYEYWEATEIGTHTEMRHD